MLVELDKTVLKNSANLKAYYRFESGALTTDSSGNSVSLTNNGTTGEGTGVFGGAADQGASNTTKYFSATNGLGIDGGVISLRIRIKLNTEIGSGNYDFISQGNDTSKVNYVIRYDYNGGTRRLLFIRGKVGVGDQSAAYTITLGTSDFYDLTLTYDGTTIRGFVNGAHVTSAAASGSGSATFATGIGIGALYGGGSNKSSALLDEAAFVSATLSADQIKELYEGRFIGELWPQSGIVGLYHLNGNSTDTSGNNRHGTDVAITYTQANGKFGKGADFNGSSSKITLVNPSVGSNFAINLWFNPDDNIASTGQGLFDTYPSAAGSLRLYGNSAGAFRFETGGTGAATTSSVGNLSGGWHMITYVLSGGSTVTVYLDGVQIGTAGSQTTGASDSPVLGNYNGGNWYNGKMEEVVFFNYVLTVKEIRRMYALSLGKYQ